MLSQLNFYPLTVPRAATYLGISQSTLYRMLQRGDIHSYKIGNSRRISEDDLSAFLASQHFRDLESRIEDQHDSAQLG
jgi:excisionase family DNA binding protein